MQETNEMRDRLINEFAEKGIQFDYNRFCMPFITDSVLWEIFGDDAPWVKLNCIDIFDGWILRLKPMCDTQSKIQKLFEKGMFSEKIKWGLFDLVSNVLFFEVHPDPDNAPCDGPNMLKLQDAREVLSMCKNIFEVVK